VEPEDDAEVQLLVTLTEALLELHRSHDKTEAFVRCKTRIDSALKETTRQNYPTGFVNVLPVYIKTVAALAGTLKAKAWKFWQLARLKFKG
jgi:hypothetical protein